MLVLRGHTPDVRFSSHLQRCGELGTRIYAGVPSHHEHSLWMACPPCSSKNAPAACHGGHAPSGGRDQTAVPPSGTGPRSLARASAGRHMPAGEDPGMPLAFLQSALCSLKGTVTARHPGVDAMLAQSWRPWRGILAQDSIN